jgi:hypothetical protein
MPDRGLDAGARDRLEGFRGRRACRRERDDDDGREAGEQACAWAGRAPRRRRGQARHPRRVLGCPSIVPAHAPRPPPRTVLKGEVVRRVKLEAIRGPIRGSVLAATDGGVQGVQSRGCVCSNGNNRVYMFDLQGCATPRVLDHCIPYIYPNEPMPITHEPNYPAQSIRIHVFTLTEAGR